MLFMRTAYATSGSSCGGGGGSTSGKASNGKRTIGGNMNGKSAPQRKSANPPQATKTQGKKRNIGGNMTK